MYEYKLSVRFYFVGMRVIKWLPRFHYNKYYEKHWGWLSVTYKGMTKYDSFKPKETKLTKSNDTLTN